MKIQQTVWELQQTIVEGLKIAGGGKLSDANIEVLKHQVIEIAGKKISDPAKNLLTAAGTDVTALITGAAEDLIAKWHITGMQLEM